MPGLPCVKVVDKPDAANTKIMSNRMLKIVVSTLLFFLWTSAQTSAQTAHYVFSENPCSFIIEENLTARCGTLRVPEDRSKPDGNQVYIAVAIFPAREPNPDLDPIFYLDGGPGADTIQTKGSYFSYYFSEFNQTRDVVLIDYRGTGDSEPNLFCNELTDFYDAVRNMSFMELLGQSYSRVLENCRRRLLDDEHLDFRMYSSAVIAEDIVDLRNALGYEQINLLGASYGTRLALTLLRDHPEGIRSAIIDGVLPPQVNLDAETILNANRAFEELFTGCAQSPRCNDAFPDLRAQFYAAAAQLEQQPVPLTIKLFDQEQEIRLDGKTFVSFMFGSLYSTDLIPLLPFIIHQAFEGNFENFSKLNSVTLNLNPTNTLGLGFAIACNEESPFNDPKETVAAIERVPAVGSFYVNNLNRDQAKAMDYCHSWGMEAPNAVENEPVQSDVPVLVLNGQFDPITPPRWGELAARSLTKSQVVTFPGMGHVASLSNSLCAKEIVLDFLSAPEARLDISCIDDTPVQWVTVDLSDSLTDIELLINSLGEWEIFDRVSTVYWTHVFWSNDYDAAMLGVTDYLIDSFPQNVDRAWFDNLFNQWDSNTLRDTCSRGSVTLYVLTLKHTTTPSVTVYYWVDRRIPGKVREVTLALYDADLHNLLYTSRKLFPELPTCGDDSYPEDD